MLTAALTATSQMTTARADELLALCQEQVRACEGVLTSGQRYIGRLQTEADLQRSLIQNLETEVKIANSRIAAETPAWYEKPGFVVPATIIGTAFTIFIVRRASQ